MPRYYCDYCDTYLTHDSPSVRKQHNAGYKHKANVRNYYQQFEEQQTQSLIDQKIKQHLSGQAAFGQIGAQYAAWRGVRPPIPILPIPGVMPNVPMPPGIRLPVLPRPAGVPAYPGAPIPGQPGPPIPGQPGPPIPGQPGAPAAPNGLPGPPPGANNPTSVPGSAPPGPGPAPTSASQPMYPGMQVSGGFGAASMPPPSSFPSAGYPPPTSSSSDSFAYSQAPNTSH